MKWEERKEKGKRKGRLVETGTQKMAQPTRRTRDFTRRKRCQSRQCIQRVEQKMRIHAGLQGSHLSRERCSRLLMMLAYMCNDGQNQRRTNTQMSLKRLSIAESPGKRDPSCLACYVLKGIDAMILDTGITCPNCRIGCPNCRLSKERELVSSPGYSPNI